MFIKRFFIFKYLFVLTVLLSPQFLFSQKDIKIGTQVWMSKNLDVDTFRNGNSILQAKDKEQWTYAFDNKTPAWCFYEFDEINGKKYGKLYNWYAVNDARGIAPEGYHVPSNGEWTILIDFLGDDSKKMKSDYDWKRRSCTNCEDYSCKNCVKVSSRLSGCGNNSSGFNGLPGGYCGYTGDFSEIGEQGYWWSSTEVTTYNSECLVSAMRFSLHYHSNVTYQNIEYQSLGFSVRCLRD
jgi:uncharacterized protein (TIGR02145 family)